MNSEQLQGIAKPLVAALVAYLAAKNILFDSETWNIIITSAVSIGLAVWSGFQHTDKAQINNVANMRDTTVFTTPTMAASLPDNPSVVSTAKATIAKIREDAKK